MGLTAQLHQALQHSQTPISNLVHWFGNDQKPELIALNSLVILTLVSMFSSINGTLRVAVRHLWYMLDIHTQPSPQHGLCVGQDPKCSKDMCDQ